MEGYFSNFSRGLFRPTADSDVDGGWLSLRQCATLTEIFCQAVLMMVVVVVMFCLYRLMSEWGFKTLCSALSKFLSAVADVVAGKKCVAAAEVESESGRRCSERWCFFVWCSLALLFLSSAHPTENWPVLPKWILQFLLALVCRTLFVCIHHSKERHAFGCAPLQSLLLLLQSRLTNRLILSNWVVFKHCLFFFPETPSRLDSTHLKQIAFDTFHDSVAVCFTFQKMRAICNCG